MGQPISQDEFNKLINLKGKVRGISPQAYCQFVLKKEGRAALKKIEETISSHGYPFTYDKINSMDFYPVGLEALLILALNRVLGYQEEDFEEAGRIQAKSSIIMRLFMKYFFSIKKVIREVPKMWNKYYTIGKLEVTEYNKEESYIILRLSDFYLTPLQCSDLKGYFPTVLQMVVGSEVECEERKCMYRGDEYHEFFMKW